MKDARHYPINANVFYGDLYKMWVSFKLIMELMENMIFPDSQNHTIYTFEIFEYVLMRVDGKKGVLDH